MTGETAEAIKYAERGENIFPYLPDIRMDHAHALIQVGRVADAIPLLLQCRQLGDVKDPLIDTVPGLGSFLAAAELGRAWLLLGDTACAAEWYLTSFRENTRQENIVWFLANLLPLEHASIRAQLYNVCKQDPLCFAYFVQACAVRGEGLAALDFRNFTWSPDRHADRTVALDRGVEGIRAIYGCVYEIESVC
ncbi:hypothetical protein [Alicyclobacillus sacchari]|uniref:hypothetical protein n=1 Tax=Alicyclobacillus sacchari TaxID=392010 RepID=UPI0024E09FCF|nr:hypothetical protein [Alicyclobacillus sacchari]